LSSAAALCRLSAPPRPPAPTPASLTRACRSGVAGSVVLESGMPRESRVFWVLRRFRVGIVAP
jgi:hypothetical protein